MSFRLLFPVLFLACTPAVTEDGFPELYAEAQCLVYKKCYRALFEGEYEVIERCEQEIKESFLEEKDELYSTCTFNVANGQHCVDLLNQATCGEYWDEATEENGEIYGACNEELWDC